MTIKRASYPIARFKALDNGDTGTFEALVSVFGNIDLWGDRVMKGAFDESLKRWRASGDPIPIIFSHQWDRLEAHIGYADPNDVIEIDEGLLIKRGVLDMKEATAARVHELMAQRRIREFSFSYDVKGEARADDGANDLTELDLIEAGPTLKGLNPDTQLIGVKALVEQMDPDAARAFVAEFAKSAGLPWVKAAIAPHSTDTYEGVWDGPAAEANLSNDAGADVYRQAFAWFDDEGDPDTKSAYAFIHHTVAEEGDVGGANVLACTSGIGILNGGRTPEGADKPWVGDRDGIYAHLAKHLRDADVEPPELKALEDLDEGKADSARVRKLIDALRQAGFSVDGGHRSKVGRTLSAKNEDKLAQARDLLDDVLASVAEQNDGEGKAQGSQTTRAEDLSPSHVLFEAELAALEV